jgi:ABC-type Fe3+/spermidine/putrescine transport system ATPase subunit
MSNSIRSASPAGHLLLQDLSKRFNGIAAVQDLWLDLKPGEILALLGPSGCGKSTTLQLVAGVLRPDSGQIKLDGRLLNRVPPEQRDIALVLQRGLLFPHLSVGENVAFGLKMRGINQSDREQKALAMLQQVQLAGFAERKPVELSGGQSQRVALARALVIRPKLLLLDEPLSALDANLRQEMQELILRLQAQTEVSLLLVTHDQAEAVVMSHRIALMFDGQLRQVDTPEQLYQQPCDEATARFMGGVNFFTAEADGRQWQVGNDLVLAGSSQQGKLRVTIRPEQIRVATTATGNVNEIAATVVSSRFTGTQRRLTLSAMNLTLQAWVSPTQEFTVGQPVWLTLPPESLWCLPAEEAVS